MRRPWRGRDRLPNRSTVKAAFTSVALTADLAVWLLNPNAKTSLRFAGRSGFVLVTNPARIRPEALLPERWPPKDGQPTPRQQTERLSMSFDRAPLASGRAAHANDGMRGNL